MSEYDKMMARVGETLDSIKKEKKDFKNAKVTDKQRAEFTKKHGKDHGAGDRVIKSYFKIQERKRLKRQSKLTGEQVKDPKAFEKEFQGGDTFFPLSLEGWPSWGKRRSLDAQHILENTDFEKMIMEAKDDKEVGEIINYTGSLRKVAEQLTPEKYKQILKNVSPTKKDLKRRRKRKLDKQMQNIKKVKIA